jgi:hypothetical protein
MIASYGWRASRKDASKRTQLENFRCVYSGLPSHDKYQIAGHYLNDAVRHAIKWVQVESNRQTLLNSYTDKTPQIRRNMEKITQRLGKHTDAMQRADDAYVIGSMTIERYQRQVEILDGQRRVLESQLLQLQQDLETEIFDSQFEVRLLELAGEGLTYLESDDIATANAWFRRHIKILVNNEDADNRIEIEYL